MRTSYRFAEAMLLENCYSQLSDISTGENRRLIIRVLRTVQASRKYDAENVKGAEGRGNGSVY